VVEVFGTLEAYGRHRDLVARALDAGAQVFPVTEPALGALADTVTPQGLVAVCRHLHREDITPVLTPQTILVVVLAGIADPGNAGTILRTADAAGVDVVVFPDGSVDPYNGKCVRASAGSLFHIDLVRGGSAAQAVRELTGAGFSVLAADAHGAVDLDERIDSGALAGPTAWLFGSEAHGLPAELADLAQARVRVPIHGRAESLNLAAAAAVCLYASARAQRSSRAQRS
jgi:TrmH family RNA methyltransferase